MKKIWLVLVGILVLGALGFFIKSKWPAKMEWKEQTVEQGDFRVLVSASAVVAPENKIAIIPPVAGRIDSLLIEEGQHVKKGQILAWVSSTDRAALLDAAHAEGDKAVKEWEDEYKPTPIISPANGIVVNRPVVNSQTITNSTTIFEISDHLILAADVDETDLAKIHLGQKADVNVDPFPEMMVPSRITRIAQQSTSANNINVYKVYLTPDKLPSQFRSGMTATVRFIQLEKKDAILLPTWMAQGSEDVEKEISVKNSDGTPVKRKIRFGKSDGEKIEVLSGLNSKEIVMYVPQQFLSDASNAGSPFSPFGQKKPGKK